MKQVSIDEIKNDLSGYLQVAERENVIITRDGQPVGILNWIRGWRRLVGGIDVARTAF